MVQAPRNQFLEWSLELQGEWKETASNPVGEFRPNLPSSLCRFTTVIGRGYRFFCFQTSTCRTCNKGKFFPKLGGTTMKQSSRPKIGESFFIFNRTSDILNGSYDFHSPATRHARN